MSHLFARNTWKDFFYQPAGVFHDAVFFPLCDESTLVTLFCSHMRKCKPSTWRRIFAHALHPSRHVTRLVIYDTPSALFAAPLANALATNYTLERLELQRNRINGAGAQALAVALRRNCALRCLDLTDNLIGNHGACELGRALLLNGTLVDLFLENNEIGRDGAVALANAIRQNKTLRTLDLRRNYLQRDGVVALVRALRRNLSLRSVYVETYLFNNLDERAVQREFERCMRFNITLQTITPPRYLNMLITDVYLRRNYHADYKRQIFDLSIAHVYRVALLLARNHFSTLRRRIQLDSHGAMCCIFSEVV